MGKPKKNAKQETETMTNNQTSVAVIEVPQNGNTINMNEEPKPEFFPGDPKEELILTRADIHKLFNEYQEQVSAWRRRTGKTTNWTEEQKANHSKKIKAYYETHDGPMKGKKLSEEAKTKISATHKARAERIKQLELDATELQKIKAERARELNAVASPDKVLAHS